MIEEYPQIRMEHFWEKVNITPSGCWEWKASLNGANGYGIFWNGERTQVAHRFLYEIVNGLVPEGFELDHIIPISKGGQNEKSNLILSCRHCNISKGARL